MRPLRFAALAATLAQVACASPAVSNRAYSVVPVTVAKAQRIALTSSSEFSGTLQAVQSATVGAMSGGRIVALDVRVGDNVSAGQTIAQVDPSQYQAQLSQAQAGAQSAAQNAQAAQAQAAAAQSRLALARTTARRMDLLYREGAISAEQHDQVQADLAAATAGLNQSSAAGGAARSAAVQAQAGITAASVPLQQTTITAPFSGIVTQKFVDLGTVVAQGSPVVALQGTQDLELDVAVPEDQAPSLKPGKAVTVRVDALGDAPIPAYIRAIVPAENSALRSVTLKISLAARRGLIAGMFARVALSKRTTPAWVVPTQSIVNREGQTGLFKVEGDIAFFIPVTTGSTNGKLVAVQGIAGSGTRVAITNLQRLADGTHVRVER